MTTPTIRRSPQMSTTNLTRIAAAMLIFAAISTGRALADKADLEARLNQDIKIDLNDVTIAEALTQIGEKAGVEFALSEAAKWKLPKGPATRLSVSLEGRLADAITQMLDDFFMRCAVGSEDVTIYPRSELNHIIGRPTIEQLKLLKKIYTSVMTFGGPDGSKIFGKMLSQGLGSGPSIVILPVSEYTGILCPFIDDLTAGLKGDGDHDQSPPMTLFQLLESVKEINGKAWYIAGPDFAKNVIEIRLVDEDKLLDYVILDQMVDLSFKDEKAEVVIEHLKMLTEYKLEVQVNDPSWLDDRISVNMQNVKLLEAIKNITTALDGGWSYDGPVIVMTVPTHRKTEPPKPSGSTGKSTAAGDAYVGKISIPMDDGKFFLEFMLRESDLTENLRKLRELKIKQILREASGELAEARLRESLKKISAEAAKSKN
jgi:hypothetical protein